MDIEHLLPYIESLIFVSETPITLAELSEGLNTYLDTNFTHEDIREVIAALTIKYDDDQYSFGVKELAGGYSFLTKGAFHEINGIVLKAKNNKKLSRTALETLSIIAYKQPVTKGEIESIRGVSSDYSIQKLMEKELIDIAGRSESLGRPLLYATSDKFMNYFGLKSINDLPKLKELKVSPLEAGEQSTDSESE